MIEYVVKNDETGELEMKPISYLAGSKDSFPVGMVTPFAGANAPEGWLICDGSEVSMTQYKALYDVIGDLYGTATNPANFVLPDLRETTPVGVGTGKGTAHDPASLGQFQDDQIQNHRHYRYYNGTAPNGWNISVQQTGGTNIWVPANSGSQNNGDPMGSVVPGTGATSANYGNGRPGATTHGKRLGMNYIIKY